LLFYSKPKRLSSQEKILFKIGAGFKIFPFTTATTILKNHPIQGFK
jgi:hypothetical protein